MAVFRVVEAQCAGEAESAAASRAAQTQRARMARPARCVCVRSAPASASRSRRHLHAHAAYVPRQTTASDCTASELQASGFKQGDARGTYALCGNRRTRHPSTAHALLVRVVVVAPRPRTPPSPFLPLTPMPKDSKHPHLPLFRVQRRVVGQPAVQGLGGVALVAALLLLAGLHQQRAGSQDGARCGRRRAEPMAHWDRSARTHGGEGGSLGREGWRQLGGKVLCCVPSPLHHQAISKLHHFKKGCCCSRCGAGRICNKREDGCDDVDDNDGDI